MRLKKSYQKDMIVWKPVLYYTYARYQKEQTC
jgi:hypothetical protein